MSACYKLANYYQPLFPSDDSLLKIASISIGVGVDGHRPDITMMHTARAHAAFHGRHKS